MGARAFFRVFLLLVLLICFSPYAKCIEQAYEPNNLSAIHTPNDSDIVGKSDISITQLAETIEKMEDSIKDVSVEYDWRIEPEYTYEESEKEISEMSNTSDPNKQKPVSACGPASCGMLLTKDGITRHRLIAAGFSKIQEPNGIRFDGPQMFKREDNITYIDREGHAWDRNMIVAWNGKILKGLNIQDQPREIRDAFIIDSTGGHSVVLTPLGFSVFKFGLSNFTDKKALSEVLRMQDIIRFDKKIRKVNGFDAVRIEMVMETTEYVVARVYFSVDQNYTPIRHAFVDPRSGNENLVFDVESLQKVSEDLWFPSAGVIRNSDENRVNRFIAKGKVLVNQGLEPKDFDIVFPSGTRVDDRITGKSYTVTSNN